MLCCAVLCCCAGRWEFFGRLERIWPRCHGAGADSKANTGAPEALRCLMRKNVQAPIRAGSGGLGKRWGPQFPLSVRQRCIWPRYWYVQFRIHLVPFLSVVSASFFFFLVYHCRLVCSWECVSVFYSCFPFVFVSPSLPSLLLLPCLSDEHLGEQHSLGPSGTSMGWLRWLSQACSNTALSCNKFGRGCESSPASKQSDECFDKLNAGWSLGNTVV